MQSNYLHTELKTIKQSAVELCPLLCLNIYFKFIPKCSWAVAIYRARKVLRNQIRSKSIWGVAPKLRVSSWRVMLNRNRRAQNNLWHSRISLWPRFPRSGLTFLSPGYVRPFWVTWYPQLESGECWCLLPHCHPRQLPPSWLEVLVRLNCDYLLAACWEKPFHQLHIIYVSEVPLSFTKTVQIPL